MKIGSSRSVPVEMNMMKIGEVHENDENLLLMKLMKMMKIHPPVQILPRSLEARCSMCVYAVGVESASWLVHS